MTEDGVVSDVALRDKNVPQRLSGRVTKFANKLLRRVAPVRWGSGKYGAMKLTAPEDAGFIPLSEEAIPKYSPLLWRFDEEPTADSRFISLILLAANHRAGSTLLQRICNARKKTLIWGEHNAVLTKFSSIFTGACQFCVTAGEEREIFFAQDEDPNLWIANMSPEVEYLQRAIINSARVFLRTFYGQHHENHDILGFKEVQYGYDELALLRRCYPDAHNLLLIRNPVNTWRSTPREWYSTLEKWIDKWKSTVVSFLNFASKDPHCHLLRYEDLINKDKETLKIVGDTAEVSLAQIKMVLAQKIGGSHCDVNPSDREIIRERCREIMESLGYL